VGDLPADEKVFQAMVGAGLKIEGVMAKRRASTYQPGVRSPDWVKIKRPGWQEGNPWRFNALSMGAREFAPTPNAVDLLLVGDSVVLGGNPYREEDRLGPQLERQLKTPVWPISAGSWALRNELTYLRHHPDVVRQVDAIVFVLNNGDFNQASSWACDLTHPVKRPGSAAVYLFRKYVHGSCPPTAPDMKVPEGDWKQDLREFLASPGAQGKPVIFFLYPDHREAANGSLRASQLEVHGPELQAQGVRQVVSVGRDPRWKDAFYRDEIHPDVEGTRVLAAIISESLNSLQVGEH
jgi:hypothetical protein